MMTTNHRQQLTARRLRFGPGLTTPKVDALLEYLGLIQKWTKVYNLTAVRDPNEMLTHQF